MWKVIHLQALIFFIELQSTVNNKNGMMISQDGQLYSVTALDLMSLHMTDASLYHMRYAIILHQLSSTELMRTKSTALKGQVILPQRGDQIIGVEETPVWDNLLRLRHFTKAFPCHLMCFMRLYIQLPRLLLTFGAINVMGNTPSCIKPLKKP